MNGLSVEEVLIMLHYFFFLSVKKLPLQNYTIIIKHLLSSCAQSFSPLIQAIKSNRLFILDHHDALMTYLRRINSTSTKTYATRTLLLLQEDGTLKPLAIELSLPHPQGERHGAVSKVFTPPEDGIGSVQKKENEASAEDVRKVGIEASIWQLAKAYAAVNDSGYHQLISHW